MDEYLRKRGVTQIVLAGVATSIGVESTARSAYDLGYNVVENPVSVHDLQATILQQLGIDHERLTYKHQGRYYRLTDVAGEVIKPILA